VGALDGLGIEVAAVLGNHDYEAGRAGEFASILTAAGVQVLEGEAHVLETRGIRVGIAGVKGFGGGFEGACGSEFGEPEMKRFMATTRRSADRLRAALARVRADFRVALLHYAPIPETLEGEDRALHAFLGSYLLGDAIDDAGADLALHGHAHLGREHGRTRGGVPVRNVAHPVIRRSYRVYEFPGALERSCGAPAGPLAEAQG
jgi:Icc-related predicted phosphoesterase